jgi:putative transposase
MTAATELANEVGTAAACLALDIPRASLYRSRQPKACTRPRRLAARALKPDERANVLAVLHTPRFADKAPAEVYATLLDDETYHCSIRTMYRILEAEGEIRERRDQLRHPEYKKPELAATGPNQLWSWDITKLLGPAKWTYFYLYVILDVFSRKAVGWMIATEESDKLAERLISETYAKEAIEPGRLTIHADRGPSMTSKAVALLMADLGVTKTHGRPHVSNDNPFSESHFKTMKYRPTFPARFGCIQDARAFCIEFFAWYNTEHRHSGVALMTPGDVHAGRASEIAAARNTTLGQAYARHPERFVRHAPSAAKLPPVVWINPPSEKTIEIMQASLQSVQPVSSEEVTH